jgi:hypothetical protein
VRLHVALAAVALTTLSSIALANEPRFGANDLETLFFISKSDDHNRVDCEFEPPPPVRTKPMGVFARMGYGISTQRVLQRTAAGGETIIELKQVARVIFITTSRGANGHCSALVRTTIANVQYAELVSIFVRLSGFLSVSYVDIKGKDLATGKPIEERLRR